MAHKTQHFDRYRYRNKSTRHPLFQGSSCRHLQNILGIIIFRPRLQVSTYTRKRRRRRRRRRQSKCTQVVTSSASNVAGVAAVQEVALLSDLAHLSRAREHLLFQLRCVAAAMAGRAAWSRLRSGSEVAVQIRISLRCKGSWMP